MIEIVTKLAAKQSFRAMKPAALETITEAQQRLKLRFAKDYCEYLTAFSAASFYGHELTGICGDTRLNVVDVTLSVREYNSSIPKDWYVIEEAHIDDIVIWQTANGEIYQSSPNNPPVKICNSLSEYIDL